MSKKNQKVYPLIESMKGVKKVYPDAVYAEVSSFEDFTHNVSHCIYKNQKDVIDGIVYASGDSEELAWEEAFVSTIVDDIMRSNLS